jgi:hypothetical protein
MQLREQKEIDAAMVKHRGKVSADRLADLVANVRAASPEKMDEVDAIFSEHLADEEKAFYRDIVTNGGDEAPAAAAPAPEVTSHERTS